VQPLPLALKRPNHLQQSAQDIKGKSLQPKDKRQPNEAAELISKEFLGAEQDTKSVPEIS